MSPRRKNRKAKPTRVSPRKLSRKPEKKSTKTSFFDTKSWIKKIQNVKMSEYEYDEELMEINSINSDADSDEYECNLKELEVYANKQVHGKEK